MGAHNVTEILKVDTNKGETLKSVWREYIDSLYHQYGHDSYNGTFTTCDGGSVKIAYLPSTVNIANEEDIWEWLDENCEKWESAKAIKTFVEKGIETWLIGGLAAS
ncbi:MAG: hypothetical protein J7L15_08255 [Clostridiales bacterium]|nr:hypothetical protein [Clostridiales bacterium]